MFFGRYLQDGWDSLVIIVKNVPDFLSNLETKHILFYIMVVVLYDKVQEAIKGENLTSERLHCVQKCVDSISG